MTDDAGEAPRVGLHDLPFLMKDIVQRLIDLGSARLQLAQSELREDVERRARRLILVVIPAGFLLFALGFLNVAILVWLQGVMGGLARAAFLLTGIYGALGVAGLAWFRATGGLNPPGSKKEGGTR